MISLIHPSRGRPEKAYNTFNKWFPYKCQYILSLDQDDPLLDRYLDKFPDFFKLVKTIDGHYGEGCFIIVNNNRSAVNAINNAAKMCFGDWMIVVSDDFEPCESWPDKIYQTTHSKTDWILKVQDGIQPWIITIPIMDREYYNRFGYIYHPDYLHMFCDTDLTCVADITGRKIKSDILFSHKHYSVTKEKPDAVNKRADATWAQGERLFLERYRRNFDLPMKGNIEDKGMINWLLKKNA